MTIKEWLRIKSEQIDDYRVFRLRRDTSRSPLTGLEHTFFVLESTDWINVIPVTPEGKVVMIRQYRHGTEEVTLEVPGGMVDQADGSPEVSAARELLEETGYAASRMNQIGKVAPNPAILNNHCYTFLASDVRRVAEPQFDGSEDIEIELVELERFARLINSGQITHALTITAFFFYKNYLYR